MILAWVMAGTVAGGGLCPNGPSPAVVGPAGRRRCDRGPAAQAIFRFPRRRVPGRRWAALLRLMDSGIAALRAGTEAPASMVFLTRLAQRK